MVPMSAAMVAAVVAWSGGSIVPVAFVALAFAFPRTAMAAAAAWAGWSWIRRARGPDSDDEARFIEEIVTELDGGASPRAALIRAGRRPIGIDGGRCARAAATGLPGDQVAAALTEALPRNGRLAGAAWALTSESGAPASPVMRLLARRAGERGRLDRERRGLTAQARATAWLIAGLPLALFAMLLATGRVHAGPSLPVAAIGFGLQAAGIGLVALMLRRAA